MELFKILELYTTELSKIEIFNKQLKNIQQLAFTLTDSFISLNIWKNDLENSDFYVIATLRIEGSPIIAGVIFELIKGKYQKSYYKMQFLIEDEYKDRGIITQIYTRIAYFFGPIIINHKQFTKETEHCLLKITNRNSNFNVKTWDSKFNVEYDIDCIEDKTCVMYDKATMHYSEDIDKQRFFFILNPLNKICDLPSLDKHYNKYFNYVARRPEFFNQCTWGCELGED